MFRKRRGCTDQIFILNAAIQKALNENNGKLFALFVDCEQAFPNVQHELLWKRLYEIGVSGKLIRIISKIYDSAHTKIRLKTSLSDPIPITKGLLQGDSLSPLLFSLFIYDLEKVLQEKRQGGVNLNSFLHLYILMYADDMVLLSRTAEGLKKMIATSTQYFDKHILKVNLMKTKVVVFRKGGNLSKRLRFEYMEQPIEIVNSYVYLGVTFTYTGKFYQQARKATNKGKMAAAQVRNLVKSTKLYDWKKICRLYDACAESVVMYAAPIWALRYEGDVERVQVQFYKYLLGMNKNTADYVVRYETGRTHSSYWILKYTFRFIISLINMPECRYVKQAWDTLSKLKRENSEYNWLMQVEYCLRKYDINVDLAADPVAVLEFQDQWLDLIKEFHYLSDTNSVINSESNSYYLAYEITPGIAPSYLSLNESIFYKQMVAKVRTRSTYFRISNQVFSLSNWH